MGKSYSYIGQLASLALYIRLSVPSGLLACRFQPQTPTMLIFTQTLPRGAHPTQCSVFPYSYMLYRLLLNYPVSGKVVMLILEFEVCCFQSPTV